MFAGLLFSAGRFWARVAGSRFEGRRALTRHRGESPVHRKSAGKSSPKGQGRELHSRRQLTKSGGGIPPRVKEPVQIEGTRSAHCVRTVGV